MGGADFFAGLVDGVGGSGLPRSTAPTPEIGGPSGWIWAGRGRAINLSGHMKGNFAGVEVDSVLCGVEVSKEGVSIILIRVGVVGDLPFISAEERDEARCRRLSVSKHGR